MANLEIYSLYVIASGLLLVALGWLWLVVAAGQVKWLWAVAVLFVVPALAFIALHFKKALRPLILMLLGGAVIAAPFGVNALLQHFLDLGPREKTVDGELHITLTGWDHTDYATVIRARPHVVVLQMANPDVTDQTLALLAGLTELRELDLSDSRVTDVGLATLRALPNLKVLRVSRTAITDAGLAALKDFPDLQYLSVNGTKITAAGFTDHLATLPKLKFVDVSETPVPKAALRSWRNQNLAEREYAPK